MKARQRSYPRLWPLVCALIISATSALGQEPSGARTRSGLFTDLITLTELPNPESMTEIELPVLDPTLPGPLARSRCFANSPMLDAATLRALMTGAKPVRADDPSIEQWHYSPWCNVAFRVRGARYSAQLFLSGRGILIQPNGKRGMFSYTYPVIATP
jgi:hypothetical protein